MVLLLGGKLSLVFEIDGSDVATVYYGSTSLEEILDTAQRLAEELSDEDISQISMRFAVDEPSEEEAVSGELYL